MRYSTSALVALAGCLLVALSGPVQAGEWDIVLNGKSFHLDADEDWNESNWGLGFEHEFNPNSRWVKLALGNGFRDSDDELSYMAGGGLKRRFRLPIGERRLQVDVGAVGFVMTRQDVNGSEPFPGILPAFSVGTRQFSVNMTYLPGHIAQDIANARTADPGLDGIVFVQFKLNSRLFGFGGRRQEFFAAN
jgi:hypothetical protein